MADFMIDSSMTGDEINHVMQDAFGLLEITWHIVYQCATLV